MLPKGNGKTTLLAWLAVHHLLSVERPAVFFGAASVAQARIGFEAARDLCARPEIAPHVVVRSLEIRRADGTGTIRMVPSDGPRTHGIIYSLAICDELWAHRDDELYLSLRSALVKRRDGRLVTISTADVGADRPLSRLRARALGAPTVVGTAPTECGGRGLRALLWEAGDEIAATDLAAVAATNPASWITAADLAGQRDALPEGAFLRFHANARVAPEGSWLPAAAWQRCIGTPHFEPGERVWIGVDVGGQRSHTAVVWINGDLHVGCSIYTGEEGVLRALEQVRDLAAQYRVEEVIADPWRWGQAALELEADGLVAVQFAQTDARMVPASQRLRDAVVERRIVLPDDWTLTRMAAAAVQRQGRRGWRLDRATRAPEDSIDGLIALCMALERAEHRPEPVRLLGWL